jgi:hypothetical protein
VILPPPAWSQPNNPAKNNPPPQVRVGTLASLAADAFPNHFVIEKEMIMDIEDRISAIGGFLNQPWFRPKFTNSRVTLINTIRISLSLGDLGRLIFVTLMVAILIAYVLTRGRWSIDG